MQEHRRKSNNYYFAGHSKNVWGVGSLQDFLAIKAQLVKRDGKMCNAKNGHGCDKEFASRQLTIDHVLPISAGGPVSDIGNMQLLCKECHKRKTMAEMLP
jgi:5-methylcytosine-specific restriction endonuclease McrA